MQNLKKIVVITGASSGLGAEFARQLDEENERTKSQNTQRSFDEFWLIARRTDRLAALAGTLQTPSRILSYDLMKEDSFTDFESLLQKEQPDIRILINAAGYGKAGNYKTISTAEEIGMIDLNCRAAVWMGRLCIPWFSKGSRLINICSTAGFQPIPGFNTYSASKSFLLRYTKGLRYEMLGSGIQVTAVCPYWVKDTEFIRIAREKNQNAFRNFFLSSRSRSVVRLAIAGSKTPLWVITPGIMCTVHRIAAKIIPHSIMVPLLDLWRRI